MEPVVLAHGNGLDEIASVLVPLAGIVLLLRAGAKRRAAEQAGHSDQAEEAEVAEQADQTEPLQGRARDAP